MIPTKTDVIAIATGCPYNWYFYVRDTRWSKLLVNDILLKGHSLSNRCTPFSDFFAAVFCRDFRVIIPVVMYVVYGECYTAFPCSFQWRYECDGVSNHQSHDCLLNCLFRRRSKKTLKLRVSGRCEVNSPVPGECISVMIAPLQSNLGSSTQRMLWFSSVRSRIRVDSW